MSEDANQLAIDAAFWSEAAMRDLLKAVQNLAAVGGRVASDINRDEHPDFTLARAEIDAAWKAVTEDALKSLARSREQFLNAARASEQAKREAPQ